MTRVVESEAAAEALIARVEARLSDLRPFWERFQRRQLAPMMLALWDRRFDLGLVHAPRTIGERQEREGYYGDHAPNRRARPDSPFLEWTGALRAAASAFTTVAALKAEIDPARNYRGPVDGGWEGTLAGSLSDAVLFRPDRFEAAVDAELQAWADEELRRA